MHIVATVLLWIIGIFSALFLPIIIIYLFTKRPNGAKFQGNHVLVSYLTCSKLGVWVQMLCYVLIDNLYFSFIFGKVIVCKIFTY